MDQRTFVERAREGDRDAFAELARSAATRLDAAARLILRRDRELARDAVQEALIRAWRDLPGLRDPNHFGLALSGCSSTHPSTRPVAVSDG